MAESRLPDVIAFAFQDYKVDEVKKVANAKCKTCRASISEKVGTTSSFVRHLSISAHPALRSR
jgi:hypothetical protein